MTISDDKLMWDMWMSKYYLLVITVSHEIGIFQAINKNKYTIDTLSTLLNIKPRALTVLINVLTALGFVIYKKNKFSLSNISLNYLTQGSSFYWGPQLLSLSKGNEHKQLLSAINEGTYQLNFQQKSFSDMWETGCINKSAAIEFTAKMQATIYAPAIAAIKSGIFLKVSQLLDLGGGSGCFSAEFVKKYDQKRATIFELPEVTDVTLDYLKKFKVTDKVSVLPGNFFKDELPKNHDGILLSQILHDWPLEKCNFLIKKVYDALPAEGNIYIHEMLLNPSKSSPITVACFDLLMFINHQSQQFTKNELFEMLRSVGFKKIRSKNTFGYYSVITAIKERTPSLKKRV